MGYSYRAALVLKENSFCHVKIKNKDMKKLLDFLTTTYRPRPSHTSLYHQGERYRKMCKIYRFLWKISRFENKGLLIAPIAAKLGA